MRLKGLQSELEAVGRLETTGGTTVAAGGAGRRKKTRGPTLGCEAHKLRSFLFTEKRPTPTESAGGVRRVCRSRFTTKHSTANYYWDGV